jgi:molybdopterin-guanine dinucleotide biosynthesis protein A
MRHRKLPISAILLFEGRSPSFGVPEGYLPWRGRSLAWHLIFEARTVFEEVSGVTGEIEWVPREVWNEIPIYQTPSTRGGSLESLVHGAQRARREVIFPMSCRWPFLHSGYLWSLWSSWNREVGYEAVVPFFKGRWWPFRALWARRAVLRGRRGGFASLEEFLDRGGVRSLRLSEERVTSWDGGFGSFREIETLSDWLDLVEFWGGMGSSEIGPLSC